MQPSRIAEFVMNRILAKSDRSGIQRRVFTRVRRILAPFGNKYVRYRLGGSEILVPFAHELPIIRSAFPQYSTNVARLCCLVSKKYPEARLIDIGANIGDTVAIVREISQIPILCVEGDKCYFNILSENIRRARFRSVEAVCAFVAADGGELGGQLVSVGGTAHFVQGETGTIKVITLSQLLIGYPEFQMSKLLKIDTDGFDCSILRSELDWLGEKKPVIFFEYDPFFFQGLPYDGRRIFKDLSEVGYSFAIVYDNFGDYLTSVDLARDAQILADLQSYFIGRGGRMYADVAVFHREDCDLGAYIRSEEEEWCLRSREGSTLQQGQKAA